MTKTCTMCHETKPRTEFYPVNRKNGTGDERQARCKMCDNTRTAERYRERKYDYAEKNRNSWLVRKYGITTEQYDAMLVAQNEVCLLCGRPERRMSPHRLDGPAPISLAIHHCHRTNRLLALVCNDCNRGMGLLGDDPERLRRAALLNEGKLQGCLVIP